MAQLYFFSFFLLLLIVVESFWIVIGCSSKAQTKQTLTNSQKKKLFFKTAVFFLNPFYRNCKKQVHKGYPLAGPCICNDKLRVNICNKKQPFWLNCYFFLLFPFTFNCGWIVLNCDWMLLQNTNKANLDKFKKKYIFSRQLVSF